MRSHDGGEGDESAGKRDGGWTEPRRRRSGPREAVHPSEGLVDALDQSLRIAESARQEAEETRESAGGRSALSTRRRRSAALPRFAPGPRELLARRLGSFVALCAAAAVVGWLIAHVLG
jgi:hypothetical protein